jgi:hypothetical protein
MVYLLIAIFVLATLAIFFIIVRKKTGQKQPSGIVFIGFLLIVAGIVFGEDRLIGYSLIGCGILLSVLDSIFHHRTGNSQ